MSNSKGFTLIEVIAALVISGIILAVAGMGIVQVTQGLVFTQKNASTSLKAQVALTRLEKELQIATNVSASSTSNVLTLTNNKGGGTATYTLCKNDTAGTIDLINGALAPGSGCTGGNHLIDNVVGSLIFSYLALDGTTTAANSAKIIDVTFQVSGAAGVASTFTLHVAPRML